MPKKKVHEGKPKGLTDTELIAKYGDIEPVIPFDKMIEVMLATPKVGSRDRAKTELSECDIDC